MNAAARPQGLPTFLYTLHTADGCECTVNYAVSADGAVSEEERMPWDPDEPELHTTNATLDIAWPDGHGDVVIELSGDEHRDLEAYDRFDDVLRAIAAGTAPRAAVDAVMAELAAEHSHGPR